MRFRLTLETCGRSSRPGCLVPVPRGTRRGALEVAPGAAAIFLVATAVLSFLPVAQVWLGKVVVERLAHTAPANPAIVGGALVPAALYAVTLAVSAGLAPVKQAASRWLQDRAVGVVDGQVMSAGSRLVDLFHIERPAFQDEWRTLQWAQMAPLGLFQVIENSLGSLLTIGALLLLLARLHPLIPVALLCALGPQAAATMRASWRVRSARRRKPRRRQPSCFPATRPREPGPEGGR